MPSISRAACLGPVLLLACLPVRSEVQGPLSAKLDRYLRQLAGYGFSGAVLAAQHGQIVLDRGYGLADRAESTPFTADTLFDVASISKPFTAAAVLRLEMQGKLKVEDPLARFFPQAPADKAGITLHQLLTHTAGLPESLGLEYEPLTRQAFLQRIFSTPLLRPPGSRFFYSNAGYSLLAAVVETVSGRPFGDFLRDELFLPAGMRHTGYLPDAHDRQLLAHGYTGDEDWGTPLDHPQAPDGPWWNLRGNGGILTTAGDLYRWHEALRGDAVLSAAERAKYEAPQVPEGSAPYPRYAYGWSVSKSPTGRRELSHVGGNGVFMSDFRRYPDDGAALVVASNSIGYSAIAIADQIERRLFGEPVAAPPATASMPADQLRRCAGLYELASGEALTVNAEWERLAVAPEGRAGLEILSCQPGQKRQHRFAEREGEVERALAAALHGDLGPMARMLVDSTAAAQRWRASVARAEAELGPWENAAVVGTRSLGGQVVTEARLTFARGTRALAIFWAGPTADGFSIGRSLRPTYFLPAGPSSFVTYDPGTEGTVTLRCAGTGAASTLRFESGHAAVTAHRRPAAR